LTHFADCDGVLGQQFVFNRSRAVHNVNLHAVLLSMFSSDLIISRCKGQVNPVLNLGADFVCFAQGCVPVGPYFAAIF
jgi:hypothetical protein